MIMKAEEVHPTDVKNKQGESHAQCFVVANDIVNSMEFLQSFGIMHRNLSSSSVGFDFYGNVKKIDSSYAREASMGDGKVEDSKITGIIGDLRYMPPEV